MVGPLIFGLIGLLIIGVPVAFSVGLSAVFTYALDQGIFFNSQILSQKMVSGLGNYLLLSIPLFIFAAKLMNSSGITQRIFGFSNKMTSHMHGGLGHANVVASLIFSGMSGAAVADAAGLGQVEVDAMKSEGYDEEFSIGITAASCIIGPIFPPSIPMVVYSFVSGASVGKLFLGGVVPGVLMAIILMGMVSFFAWKKDYPRTPFVGMKSLWKSFLESFFPLLTPVILLSGIWSGIFTPTEAAAVAVLYAMIISIFALRELNWRSFFRIAVEAAKESGIICFVICAASFYAWLMMRTGFTVRLAGNFLAVSENPLVILGLINLFLLIVGCFLDPTVAILILAPIFVPVVTQAGIDVIHFGVIMVLNLMIGLLTPPFGIVLFVMKKLSTLSFAGVCKAVAPFLIPLFVVLLLVIFVPQVVLFLPSLIS